MDTYTDERTLRLLAILLAISPLLLTIQFGGWYRRKKKAGSVLLHLCRHGTPNPNSAFSLGLVFWVFFDVSLLLGKMESGSSPFVVPLIGTGPYALASLAMERRLPFLLMEKGVLLRYIVLPWQDIESYHLIGDQLLVLAVKRTCGYRFKTISIDYPAEKNPRLAEILAQYAPGGPVNR